MKKANMGRRAKTLPEDVARTEAQFARCPKGHAIPHRTSKGNCSPLFCAGGETVKASARRKETQLTKADKNLLDLADATPEDTDLEEQDKAERKIAQAQTRHRARMKFVKVPEMTTDEARGAWIESQKKELAVIAMAETSYSLRLGDQMEREKARREVLDMAGHTKKEVSQRDDKPLIIVVGGPQTVGDSPWLRRIGADGKELPSGKKE